PCCRTSRATSPDMVPGPQGTEARWRLLLGTAAFVVWAPPSLLGLPLAGLLLATRPRTTAEWGAAGGVGVLSAGLLLLPATDLLTGFVRAYTVLVTAAFVVVTLFAGGEETLLARAIRAGLIGGVAARSEEHTSELQSLAYLVCRL